MRRGEVYWVDLGESENSRPARRRPVVIVSDDLYNASRLSTVVAVAVTGTLRFADLPGNVLIPKGEAGLTRASVANVTSLLTLDKAELGPRSGRLQPVTVEEIDEGLRRVLGL